MSAEPGIDSPSEGMAREPRVLKGVTVNRGLFPVLPDSWRFWRRKRKQGTADEDMQLT